MLKSVKIDDKDYEKIKQIAKGDKDRKYTQVLSSAINLYYKLKIGNRLNTKKE